MRLAICAAALAPFILVTACANTGPNAQRADGARRQCFFASSANNFVSAGANAVHVRVGVRDVFRLELMGHCPDIDWSHRIALATRGSSSICTGSRATIIVRGVGGRMQRCPVLAVSQLTPEQIAALPSRQRP